MEAGVGASSQTPGRVLKLFEKLQKLEFPIYFCKSAYVSKYTFTVLVIFQLTPDQCDFMELCSSSEASGVGQAQQTGRTPLEGLNMDVLGQVVGQIGCADLAKLATVSKHLGDVCNNTGRLKNCKRSVGKLMDVLGPIVKHEYFKLGKESSMAQSRNVHIDFAIGGSGSGNLVLYMQLIAVKNKPDKGCTVEHQVYVQVGQGRTGKHDLFHLTAEEFQGFFDGEQSQGARLLYGFCEGVCDGVLSVKSIACRSPRLWTDANFKEVVAELQGLLEAARVQ